MLDLHNTEGWTLPTGWRKEGLKGLLIFHRFIFDLHCNILKLIRLTKIIKNLSLFCLDRAFDKYN